MLQRIQSIFLLLGSGSCFGLLGLPFAETPQAQSGSSLFADALYTIQDNWVLLASFLLGGLVLLLDIFLFKNRRLQSRLSLLSIVIIFIGVVAGVLFFVQDSASRLADFGLGALLPLLAIVFAILANRYIMKDEKLVRSMDRLR